MLSFCVRFLLLSSLLMKNFITSEENLMQEAVSTIFLNIPVFNHQQTYNELRDNVIPKIHQISQKIQLMIVLTSKEFDKMEEYNDITNQSCLTSSLILYINQLSTNLTRIIRTEVPFLQKDLKRIVDEMDTIENKIKKTTHVDKQQLETLNQLIQQYRKLNDELRQLYGKLSLILNEILFPGLKSFGEYNECLKSKASALIDYSLDQLIEHIDDYDENELLFADDVLRVNNHTDL